MLAKARLVSLRAVAPTPVLVFWALIRSALALAVLLTTTVITALPKAPFTETPVGEATVETYTVMHGRGGPEFAVVFGRLNDTGQRFIANLPDDPARLWELQNHDSLGRPGRVSASEGRNVFMPRNSRQ